MKRNVLIGFTIAAITYANMSNAGFTFYSNSPVCDNVSGHWMGTGKISHWLVGQCSYIGDGQVSFMDPAGNFTLTVSVDKSDGSFVCPGHSTTSLNAVCHNGVVTVDTGYGILSGSFSDNQGNAAGTLSILGSVDVDIKFYRK